MGPTMETWTPIFGEIALSTTVFAYDRPGYGRSRSHDHLNRQPIWPNIYARYSERPAMIRLMS